MARHVYAYNGAAALAWEIAYQCAKPFLRAYTTIAWRYRRLREVSSAVVSGHRLAILPQDKGVSIELSVYGTHEPRASRLLSECLQPGMVAVDIGANIGYFALLESRLVGRNGRVLAVEPVPENARVFLQNVKNNRISNIRFQQLAISDRDGVLPLHLSEKSNCHSLHAVPWATSDLPVRVSTLDRLLEGQDLASVDLVRMDLEGHELVVLAGMRQTIERYSPRLLIEIHPHIVGPAAMTQYLDQLKSFGYAPEWVLDQERDVPFRWHLLRPERPTMDELISDWRIHVHPRALMLLLSRKSATSDYVNEPALCLSAVNHQRG